MSAYIPDELKAAKKALDEGGKSRTTVRNFLSWFGASRRRHGVVSRVRAALEELGCVTYPDFEGEYIDSPIFIMDNNQFTPKHQDEEGNEEEAGAEKYNADPAHRLGRLRAANCLPTSVAPGSPLQTATSLMLVNDFSQLPVMSSERNVKGMISWKSIGSKLALGQQCVTVDDCLDKQHELKEDASIFDAITIISQHDCVLVRDGENKISGVVTAADINEQYHVLAEPFLLLGDIENCIRIMISAKFTPIELAEIRDPEDKEREINDASDLSFGEYKRLLEKPERWEKVDLKIDRLTFIKELDKVREIRNDIMHFDPDGIQDDALDTLRRFRGFLVRLQKK